MALIGTISGSNGTSTTAISGSLIIADAPAATFPRLSGGVKFLVSGSRNADRTDNPQFLFNVDVFHSGAIGSDQFMQFKPVGALQIPTNTTASYIYTSGSTNDLYFTQYNGPYTNTTRLRWLEASLGTGLLAGGTLSSTSGSTTYNITSGSGLIVSYNAHTELGGPAEPYPTITRVQWPDLNAQSLPSLSTTQITYVGMDSTGTPYLKSTPFIDGDFDTYISLGRILHTDKVGTNGAVNQPTVSYGQTHFRGDFVRSFGPIKLSGHTFYANGTQGLAKDAGDSYAEGRNYTVDPDSPNYVKSTTDTAQPTSKIFYQYVNGAGDDVILNNGNLGYTVLDCNNYNNAGTLTTVGAGNKFTIQRVFWFPNAVNRAFYVYYGNTIYATIADAQAGIATEVFTEGKNTRDGAIFLGYVIAKGVTLDFTDPTTYKIIQAGAFRAVASSGAGATGTPGGADTYVQFNDATVFNGTRDFRFVKGKGTALVANLIVSGTSAGSLVTSGTLQVKDGTGNIVGSISTGGVIIGSSDLQMGGNITGSNGRLSKLNVGGNGTFLTSSDGTSLVVSSSNTLSLGSVINKGVSFNLDNVEYAKLVNVNGTDTQFGTVTKALTLTGSGVSIDYGTAATGIQFNKDASTFARITFTAGAPGQATLSMAAPNNNLAIGTSGTGITTLSGSGMQFNFGNTGINFLKDGTTVASFISPTTTFPILSAQVTNAAMTIGTAGGTSDRVVLSGSAVQINNGAIGIGIQRDGSTVGTISGVSGSSFSINMGTGVTTANIVNTIATTVNIAGAGTSVNIGAATGRTTISNDLGLTTGNVIGAPGSGANVLTLISSGNIVAKLDINNDSPGHKFDIQDYNGISQFWVGENGNAELSGSIYITGSTNVGTVVENLVNSNGSTGTTIFNLNLQGIFYVNSPVGDITANFTNVPTTNLRILTPTVILSQSATARIVSAVQIDGVGQTINWANGLTPAGSANKQDVFGFSLIRSGSAWKVLGQMSTYG